MASQHGGSLGLGRMRGEDGLHVDARQSAADFLGGVESLTEALQLLGPSTGSAGGTFGDFSLPAYLRGSIFFGHAHQLEHHRDCFYPTFRNAGVGEGSFEEAALRELRESRLTGRVQ